VEVTAPFEKAVKHLFRHLHDGRALSRNPIVQRLFDNPSIAVPGRERDRAILNRIHELVRQGADKCRDADLGAGRRERALRQHSIITLQCLGQRPIREVAESLGISYYHCYRERANICRRVARFIWEHDDPPVLDYLAELDEFRSLADLTSRHVDSGDVAAALRHTDALILAAASAEQKVEALSRKALVSLAFGNVKRAESAFNEMKMFVARQLGENASPVSDPLQVWVDVAGSKFAQYRGNSREAISIGQRAVVGLEPLQCTASGHIRELYTESLYEVGVALWNIGERHRGHEYLVKAEESLRYAPKSSNQLQSQITVTLWKQRSRLLMSSKAWHPTWQRLRGLRTAFEDAYASGSLPQAMDALGVITECNALAGRKADALHAAALAVSLAKRQANEKVRKQVSIDIAAKLVRTEQWEDGLLFFSDVDRFDSCEAFYRANALSFTAVRALRLRRFQEAWRLANLRNESGEYADLALTNQLVAASAAYALGWQPKANLILEALIPEAEALGSTPILRDAYNLASKVRADSRLRHKARELTRLLAT
jgi:hypothetical protein